MCTVLHTKSSVRGWWSGGGLSSASKSHSTAMTIRPLQTDCSPSAFSGAAQVYVNAMLRDFDDECRLTEVQRSLTARVLAARRTAGHRQLTVRVVLADD